MRCMNLGNLLSWLRTVALLAAVAFCTVGTVRAQEGDVPSVQFNFEQAEIRLVTKLVGQLTGRTFIVPDGVQGKLTILTRGPVAADEVWPLFTGALEAAGYAVREEAGAWHVVQLPGRPRRYSPAAARTGPEGGWSRKSSA